MIQIIQRRGRTILFSSHILGNVERVADRIGILDDGVLRVDCPTDHFKESVRKVLLEFGGQPPEMTGCPGLVNHRMVGRKLELVVVGYGESLASCSSPSVLAGSSPRFQPGRRVYRVHPRPAPQPADFCRRGSGPCLTLHVRAAVVLPPRAGGRGMAVQLPSRGKERTRRWPVFRAMAMKELREV